MQSITACLIVRNESKVIERCLKSVKDVDNIVVLDTGSTDSTPEICIKNKAKVYYDVWRDNFAEARNKALEYCTSDWIFSIDADEYVTPGTIKFIREFIKKNKGNVFTCYVRTGDTLSIQPRIFRNNPTKIYWKGAAHNYINYAADKHINIEITSTSEGYSHKNDPDRGIRILRKSLEKDPNAIREMYYLGLEYKQRCQYEIAIFWLLESFDTYPNPETKAEIMLSAAKCYIHLKRIRKAINCLHESIKINPSNRECYTLLGLLTKKPIYADFAKQVKQEQVAIREI